MWTPVTRGGYRPTGADWSAQREALARIVAVHHRLRAEHWFSHESAALVWGLPVLRVPTVTHLRQATRASSHRDRAVARHVGTVPEKHQAIIDGIPVTDLTWTMVDCARSSSGCAALVVADAALAAGADRSEACELVAALGRRSGTARARDILAAADDGAESPGETLTRAALLAAGLPAPLTQVPVDTRLGRYWADLGYPSWRVAVEYDGHVKYDDRTTLIREKRRHDAMVEAGWHILRVTKEDLRHPQRLLSRLLPLLPPLHLTPAPSSPASCCGA